MSANHMIDRIKSKISRLNLRIRMEMKRPRPSFTMLRQLKKEKLLLKDQKNYMMGKLVRAEVHVKS